MKTNKNVIRRNIAGDDILIPVNEAASDHNGLFVFTATGAKVWDMLDENKPLEEIITSISEEYGVDTETVREDVEALIGKLKALGLLED